MAHRMISAEKALRIYLADGLYKNIAVDNHVSTALVHAIKKGDRYGDVTAAWRAAQQINAALISATFYARTA